MRAHPLSGGDAIAGRHFEVARVCAHFACDISSQKSRLST
jgi:hypothetical protein